MNITIINRLAGISQGGGETFDVEAARALRKLGHSVKFVIGRRWSKLDIPMIDFQTTYIRTPYLRWLAYRTGSMNSWLLQKFGEIAAYIDIELFERKAFRKIIEGNVAKDTDVFQINGLPRLGSWLRQKLGVDSVIVWHGPPSQIFRRWNEQCSASFAFGDTLKAVKNVIDPQAVEIPPGVNLSIFRRNHDNDLRGKYNIPRGGIVFTFAGRLIPVKNLSFLIETFSLALKENPFLYLLIIGEGVLRPMLQKQVTDLILDSNVFFTGQLTGEELATHYNNSDVFIIPSKYESFSLVTIEAMACGLPIIASRVGWLPKLIDDGKTGVLFKNNNKDQLKSVINLLANESNLRIKLGNNGYNLIKNKYSWTETANKMISLYNSLQIK